MNRTTLSLLLPLALLACDSGSTTDTSTTDTSGDSAVDTDTGDSAVDTSETGDTADTAPPTLYETLGGEAGVHAVISQFLANVGADANINWFFADTDMPALQGMLEDQVCAATGGGCAYTGGTMLEVHAGMAITTDQFNSLAGDLLAALTTLGVPYALDGSQPIDTLLIALVGMQVDIVTDPAGDVVYFNQLGGHAAVEAVITHFLEIVAADTRVNGFFASSDLTVLGGKLVSLVCDVTGGSCAYKGKSMLDAHTGMGISEDDFSAVVQDMIQTFDDLSIPHSVDLDGSMVGDSLLLTLLSLHDDIVGH